MSPTISITLWQTNSLLLKIAIYSWPTKHVCLPEGKSANIIHYPINYPMNIPCSSLFILGKLGHKCGETHLRRRTGSWQHDVRPRTVHPGRGHVEGRHRVAWWAVSSFFLWGGSHVCWRFVGLQPHLTIDNYNIYIYIYMYIYIYCSYYRLWTYIS